VKFNPNFSRFDHVRYDKNPRTITLEDFLKELRSDRHKVACDFIRSTTDKDAKSKAKGKLPCVTLSAICEGGHGKKDMQSYTSLIQLDFDLSDNPHLADLKKRLFARFNLSQAPHVLSVFTSPSGGLKAIVLTEAQTFEEHKRGFEAALVFAEKYGLKGDSGVSDESRACYLSHDRFAHLATNIELLDSATEGSEYDEERDQHYRALPFVPLPIAAVKKDPIFEPARPVNSAPSRQFEGESPIDVYNASDAWKDELHHIGCMEVKDDRWRHKEATAEHSAVWGKVKGNLHVFSSNMHPFEAGTNYRPFDILKACRGFSTAEAVAFLRGDSLPKLSPEVEASIDNILKNAKAKQADEVPSEEASLTLFNKIQSRKFDAANPIEPIPAFLNLGDTPIIRRGNISTLTAQKSAGKTHALSSIMRALTLGERSLGFNGKLEGKIAYLDFEQSGDDFDHALRFQARAAETDKIEAYHLTGLGHKDARAVIASILMHEEGLKLLVIDGYADCVSSVNDDEACAAFVSSLLYAAQEKQIAILGVLHLNPGSDFKSRGHLGSELDRKSETVLQITQDGEIREIWTSKARKKPISKGSGIRFEWSDAAKGFVEIAGTRKDAKQAANVEEWKRTLYDIQEETGMQAWKYSTLIEAILKAEKCSRTTAKNRHSAWLEAGLLTHSGATSNYTSTLGSGATFGNGLLATV
jgi:hypothetical protein